MARSRDPTRDKAYVLWLKAGGSKSKRGILNNIAKDLGINVSLLRKWKCIDNWEEKEKRKSDKSNITYITDKSIPKDEVEFSENKQKYVKAEAMYVAGCSNQDIAQTLNIKIGTVNTWSSRYDWLNKRMEVQLKVMDILYEKVIEKRVADIEKIYGYVDIIRNLIMTCIVNKEKSIKEKATEISALSGALKVIEDSNRFQNRLIGLSDNPISLITREYEVKANKNSELSTNEENKVIETIKEFQKKLERDKSLWSQMKSD